MQRSWLRWLVVVIFLAGIGGFYALGLQQYFSWDHVRANRDALQAQVDAHQILAAVAFFVIYTVMTAFSVPAAWILTLLGGALFGRLLGTALALSAATIGATLAFLSSRFLFRDAVQRRLGRHLEMLNRGVENEGAYYLFSLRLVPFFPFFLINLGMGLTPISTWTYFWVSFVGMLPGSFIYINAGCELGSLDSPRDILSPGLIAALVLLGIAPLAFRKLLQWLNRART